MIKSLLIACFLFLGSIAFSQKNDELKEESIDELNSQLDNPLSRFWSLIFQENMAWNTGDLIEGRYHSCRAVGSEQADTANEQHQQRE